jgi:hypothetical protein
MASIERVLLMVRGDSTSMTVSVSRAMATA